MSLTILQNYSFLKSSRYSFSLFSLPKIMDSNSAVTPETYTKLKDFLRETQFLCDSIEFPGQTINTVDTRISGQYKIKVPLSREYGEITATFYYPSETPVYEFFSLWAQSISKNTARTAYYRDCVSQAIIRQYAEGPLKGFATSDNDKDLTQLKIKLFNIFPTNFAPLNSNWADDGFHKMTVTFFYENIEIVDSYAMQSKPLTPLNDLEINLGLERSTELAREEIINSINDSSFNIKF